MITSGLSRNPPGYPAQANQGETDRPLCSRAHLVAAQYCLLLTNKRLKRRWFQRIHRQRTVLLLHLHAFDADSCR